MTYYCAFYSKLRNQRYIAMDGVYAASQQGAGAAIATNGVYAANLPEAGTATAQPVSENRL